MKNQPLQSKEDFTLIHRGESEEMEKQPQGSIC